MGILLLGALPWCWLDDGGEAGVSSRGEYLGSSSKERRRSRSGKGGFPNPYGYHQSGRQRGWWLRHHARDGELGTKVTSKEFIGRSSSSVFLWWSAAILPLRSLSWGGRSLPSCRQQVRRNFLLFAGDRQHSNSRPFEPFWRPFGSCAMCPAPTSQAALSPVMWLIVIRCMDEKSVDKEPREVLDCISFAIFIRGSLAQKLWIKL
jgi:hypothetical protein